VLPALWLTPFNLFSSIGLSLASLIALVAITTAYKYKTKPLASVWGGSIAHIGMAITIAGISITGVYSSEKDIKLDYGESYVMNDYSFKFIGVSQQQRANYRADIGLLEVSKDGHLITLMKPEKRLYDSKSESMTEAAIDAGFFRDLFVALGEPLSTNSWSLRIYHKPFIRWIWLGALLMALGAALAVTGKRYSNRVAHEQ